MLLLLLVAAAIAPAAEPKPTPLSPQHWVTNADYPADAIRAGEQGTVAFKLDVSAEGRVTGCTITGSSSSRILDASTCRLVVSRGRFTPARDRSGKAIASTYNSRFRWALPQPKIPAAGLLVTTVDLSPDGTVEKCSADSFGGAPTGAGAKSCQVMDLPFQAAFLKQHAAVYRRIRFASSISVNERQFPVEDRGWGTLLIRSGVDVDMDHNGRPIRCTPGTLVGMKAIGDPCAALRRHIPASAAPDRAPAQTIRTVSAVFGEPR
jgi:protein TonB